MKRRTFVSGALAGGVIAGTAGLIAGKRNPGTQTQNITENGETPSVVVQDKFEWKKPEEIRIWP